MSLIHIGRKCPKGCHELPGGMHLGRGLWALRCECTEPISIIHVRTPDDPSRWCVGCGATVQQQCTCGPIADNN